MDEKGLIQPSHRVMHIAPERGISARIQKIPAIVYEAYDLFPENYSFAHAKKMDLAKECETLPSDHYDVIIHSHVMEHIQCNFTAVMFHLQRALTSGGVHIFSVPILSGHYDDCLGGLTDEDRIRRFGQIDHVRRFGSSDIHASLGMIFPLPKAYNLEEELPATLLDKHNIPQSARVGFSSSSVFVMRKDQFKLASI
ncbi:MAG: methyltransferase domain-containing protein [bacterium]